MQRAVSFLWRWGRKISHALLSNKVEEGVIRQHFVIFCIAAFISKSLPNFRKVKQDYPYS